MSRAIIALGSNLEIPLRDLKSIPQFLVENVKTDNIILESVSPFYKTPAFPAGSGPDFVNAAFSVLTELSPEALLTTLHKVETEFGRERPYRWAPRTLDLDLIYYDDKILPDAEIWQLWAEMETKAAQASAPETLILPHPRAHERSFVLGPLHDIAPDFIHPALQRAVSELWQALPETDRQSLERL